MAETSLHWLGMIGPMAKVGETKMEPLVMVEGEDET